MKRRILLILSGLIILSAAANACTTPTGELYVNSDTTLCPGTYIIDDSDYDGAVIINASNAVLDCDGATLDANGSAGYAILAEDVTGITVKNCNIDGYTWGGIEFEGVNYSVIDSNNISSCGAYGHGAVFIPYSSYNNITGNRITSNPLNAISIGSWYPTSCQGNRVTGNTITGNTLGGVSIQQPSSSTVLEDNYICGNGDSDIDSGNASLGTGSGNTCDTASNWNDDGTTGCTYACAAALETTCNSCSDCNTKLNGDYDVVKLAVDIINDSVTCINFSANNTEFDCQGHVIDGDGSGWDDYGLLMDGKSGNTIKNCVVTGFLYGIRLCNSSNNTLINNTADSNDHGGIRLIDSSNNTLAENTLSNNFAGISFSISPHNTLIGNNASNNDGWGIFLSGYNNTVINNTANSNHDGIYLSSYNNTLTNNTANSNDEYGIYICATGYNNTLTGNTASNNYFAIYIAGHNNTLNSNRFCSSTGSDFYLYGSSGNSGDENTCGIGAGWNDDGTTGCTYACAATTTTTTSTSTTTTVSGALKGDADGDGTVTDFELLSYIDTWVSGAVTDFDLLEAIDNWTNG